MSEPAGIDPDRNVVKKERINVRRLAHVYVMPNTGASEPTDLWIVLHGYGETADAFIEQFDCIRSDSRVFCAPEGLSRFYRAGTNGQIGASWMTSRDRESEIADYVAYLDDVLESMRQSYPRIESLTVVGFSQGTATATRWIANSDNLIDRLLLWGGTVADDVAAEDLLKCLRAATSDQEPRPIDLIVGSRDKFIGDERLEAEMRRLDGMGIPYVIHRFPGGHRMDSEMLVKLTTP